MVAMGLVGDASELGLEGSGVVRRVGEQVTDFAPGDEVVVVAPGILRNQVIVERRRCRKLNQLGPHVDLEGAATMPTVYATALWVFGHLAKLRKDQVKRRAMADDPLLQDSSLTLQQQTVLIHSACGGVGLASIRVCQQLGAKVPTDSRRQPVLSGLILMRLRSSQPSATRKRRSSWSKIWVFPEIAFLTPAIPAFYLTSCVKLVAEV